MTEARLGLQSSLYVVCIVSLSFPIYKMEIVTSLHPTSQVCCFHDTMVMALMKIVPCYHILKTSVSGAMFSP